MNSPTLDDVAEQLRALIAGSTSREVVALWAAQWLTAPDPGVDDETVWDALVGLGAADLKTVNRPYLYGDTDFRAWLKVVEDALSSRR